MPPYPPGRPQPCCVEVPAAQVAPARHGLEVLLAGLGLEPEWVDRDAVKAGGLYYGTDPLAAHSQSVRVRMDPALGVSRSVDPPSVSRLAWKGDAWPLLYPASRTFGAPAGDVEDADVVASTHAWTSGLLEAGVTPRDIHGRLRDEDAPPAVLAAARPDLVDATHRPPVDAYRDWLGAALARSGAPPPGRTWGGHAWAVVPTVDVDMVRTRRPGAWLGADPRRRRLAQLIALFSQRSLRATFFLKAGATAEYDVPYALDHPTLERVWEAASAGTVEVGLHPSYFVHDHPQRLASELARLEAAAAPSGTRRVPVVRTHFLRWTEPGTPRALVGAGFAVDTSLGFAGRVGFRRGTAVPYRLYDVVAGRALDLWEVPLCAMDTALFVHGRSGRDGALSSIESTLEAARSSNGAAVLLWHNEPLGASHLEVLASALDLARSRGALVDGLGRALSRWQVG